MKVQSGLSKKKKKLSKALFFLQFIFHSSLNFLRINYNKYFCTINILFKKKITEIPHDRRYTCNKISNELLYLYPYGKFLCKISFLGDISNTPLTVHG